MINTIASSQLVRITSMLRDRPLVDCIYLAAAYSVVAMRSPWFGYVYLCLDHVEIYVLDEFQVGSHHGNCLVFSLKPPLSCGASVHLPSTHCSDHGLHRYARQHDATHVEVSSELGAGERVSTCSHEMHSKCE